MFIFFSVNTIFECLYIFWFRKESSIKYVRNCWRNVGSSKVRTAAYTGKVCHAPYVYIRTYIISFRFFGNIFML